MTKKYIYENTIQYQSNKLYLEMSAIYDNYYWRNRFWLILRKNNRIEGEKIYYNEY